jgi:hypothetical protein
MKVVSDGSLCVLIDRSHLILSFICVVYRPVVHCVLSVGR